MSAIVTAAGLGRDAGEKGWLSARLTEPKRPTNGRLGDTGLLDVPEARLEGSYSGLPPLICAHAAEIDDLSTAKSTSSSVAASRLSREGATDTLESDEVEC